MVGNVWRQEAHVAHWLTAAPLAVALGRRPSALPARRGNGAQGTAAGCGWRRWGPRRSPEAKHNERSFLQSQPVCPSIFASAGVGSRPIASIRKLHDSFGKAVPRQFAKCDAITQNAVGSYENWHSLTAHAGAVD